MSLIKYNLVLRDFRNYIAPCIRNRLYSTVAANDQSEENSPSETTTENTTDTSSKSLVKKISKHAEYRFIYPEFLSNPKFEYRHKLKEKLERLDMLKRRNVINIPEFYVGSILAVTVTDPYAPGKKKKFVGICIYRTYEALKATFTLRNIVDGQGVEIMYDLYNPTIISIEVLRLEKRLDEELFYLRDAPPEYSTFDFDMEAEFRREGEPVPINTLKVKLKPFPWHARWEIKYMKGIESTDDAPLDRKQTAKLSKKPWEDYDLMKEYRRSVPEEEQMEMWEDVEAHKKHFPSRQQIWKKQLLKAQPKVQPK